MANSNFIVHNGLQVGPLTIWAANGDVTTSGAVASSSSTSTYNDIFADTISAGIIGNSGALVQGLSFTSLAGGQITGYHTGAIGANTANTGVFTSVTTVSGGQVTGYMTGPIGANTANSAAFTTLTTTQTIIATGNIVSSSSTDSTTTTTGSLVLAGGLGVAKNMTIGGNITPSANVTYNLGTNTANWNNIYAVTFSGTSTTAKYADLAECYAGDQDYEAGTVVDFGGKQEITLSDINASQTVAGIVSTNPAHLMNSAIDAEFPVAVALAGRVPCKVTGPIRKGQMMVSAGNGRARAESSPTIGTVIGKAIENHSDGDGVIEVVVGRL